ncbi:MAG: DUF1835 domain-containing protein [Bacilli bacterium]|nr:DUF1835 domain-containing protein [Bacilli bacterium]
MEYFNLKNFVGINTEAIEILPTEAGLRPLENSGNNNLKVVLPLFLEIGSLRNIEKFDRSELSKYDIGFLYENGYNFEYEFNELKKYVDKAKKIRVWSSHLDSNDYCLLLLICYYFKDKDISVVYSEESNHYSWSISCIDESEIKSLEQKEHILLDWQKEELSNKWLEIIKENKELRYMINGEVISVEISYFDEYIIERLKNLGKVKYYSLIGNLIGNPIIPNIVYSDYVYKYLIDNLINKGLINLTIENDIEMIEVKEVN